ncbi:MAG: protein O-mannosyl-transferase family [Anaerolineae bacterium]
MLNSERDTNGGGEVLRSLPAHGGPATIERVDSHEPAGGGGGANPSPGRADPATAAVLAVAAGLLYLATTAPSVATVFDDSLEFQVVLPSLGIAHPSGYPLYTLLGHAFSLLLWGSAAFRVNAMSACCGALAVALLYAVCRQGGCRRGAAVVASVALAVSPVWWSQATIAEVYTLHVALALLIVWLSLRLAATRGSPDMAYRRAQWLALALGVGLTHHRMTVLLVPAAVVALLYALGLGAGWRRWLRLALLAAAPLLLYAYIPIRGLVTSSLDGTYRNTVAGFLAHVSASGYGTFLSGNPLGARVWSAGDYLALFRQQFGYLGLLLAAVGIGATLRRSPTALLLGLALLANLAFALAYRVPDVEVFFLPSIALLCVYLGLGLTWVWRQIDRWKRGSAIGVAAAALVALALLVPLPVRWLEQDRSASWTVHDTGVSWLQAVAPNGVVVGILGETTLMRYFQDAEGLRRDVGLVAADDEAGRLQAVRAFVAQGRPTYVTRPLAGLAEEFALDAAGPLVRVSPVGSDSAADGPGQPVDAGLSLQRWQWEVGEHHGRAQVAISVSWLATSRPERDLKVSVRAERGGVELARLDGYPVHDAYRTPFWSVSAEHPVEVVDDFYLLDMPVGDPGGAADLTLVLYQAGDGAEVARVDLGSAVVPASRGSRPLLEWGASPLLAYSAAGLQLLAAEPAATLSARAGESLPVDTLWRVTTGGAEAQATLRLLSAGREYARLELQADTSALQRGDMLRLRGLLPLPARLETGRYQLVLEGPGSGPALFVDAAWPPLSRRLQLATVDITGRTHSFTAPSPQTTVGATFARGGAPVASLLGYDLHVEGSRLQLTLYWQALAEPDARYKVFVHCLDPAGTMAGQDDAEPAANTAPTDSWLAGEYVVDRHTIDLADGSGRPLQLLVGLYREGEGRLQPGGDRAIDGALLLTEIGK